MKTNSRFIKGSLSAIVLVLSFTLTSCNGSTSENAASEAEMPEGKVSEGKDTAEELNTDSLITYITEQKNKIEGNLPNPVQLSTDSLRAKIRQKWSQIHYYEKNGEVIRVKTYPHSEVSNRTEEFYLQNGELIAVVIEDDGSGERGKAKENLDKIYYFHNDELIREDKNISEEEYGDETTDTMELRKELKEYLEIFRGRE